MSRFLALCGLVAALTTPRLAAADSSPAYQRPNPFKPPLQQPSRDSRAKSHAPASAYSPPRLRAVLAAPEGSLVNLNGYILAEGESALGYQLLAVHEHSADFNYRGQRLRLHVRRAQESTKP